MATTLLTNPLFIFSIAIALSTFRAYLHRIQTKHCQKNNMTNDHNKHFLDVILKNESEQQRIITLSEYLSQLSWSSWMDPSGDVFLYDFIITWCLHKRGVLLILLPLFGILPRKLFGKNPLFSSRENTKHDLLTKISNFLQVNSMIFDAACADVYGYLKSRYPSSMIRLAIMYYQQHQQSTTTTTKNIQQELKEIPRTVSSSTNLTTTITNNSDAVLDLLQHLSIDKEQTSTLMTIADFRNISEHYALKLDDQPHTFTFDCPQPIFPDIFPNLSIGWGGLHPLQTPMTAARNQVISEILNRLIANVYIAANLDLSSNTNKEIHDDINTTEIFKFKYNGQDIITPRDFIMKIPGIRVFFSKNSSSFGKMFCVKQPGSSHHPDIKDPASMECYKQIPLSWPSRIGIRDPRDGSQLFVMAYHNSLVIEGHPDKCPLGAFRAQFFLGPEGCTSWKAGNEYIRSWAPLQETSLERESHLQEKAVGVATAVACAMNWSASRSMGLHKGGYGIFGSCMDSTALIQMALWGKCDVYPIMISGPAKAHMIQVCNKILIPRLIANKQEWSQTISDLRLVVQAVLDLPCDLDVQLRDTSSTCRRLVLSNVGSFLANQCITKQAEEIERIWEDALVEESTTT
jgi:hypothetical protein